MGRLSNTVMNAVLDKTFGAVNWTPPATLYIGLSTTAPANDGTNITEPTGNGYARVAVPNDTTNWPTASGRGKTNANAITFPAATGSWGTVTHFVIYDAATAGNFYGWGQLNVPQAVTTGIAPSFATGSFVVSGPGS